MLFSFTTKNKVADVKRFSKQKLSFEALEPRLLLSADAFGGLVDADDITPPVASHSALDKIREDLDAKLQQPITLDSLAVNNTATDSNTTDFFEQKTPTLNLGEIGRIFSNAESTAALAPSPLALVFVDAELENRDVLLKDLDAENAQVFFIDQAVPALEQITDIINQHSDVASIHLLGHGSDGNLNLGGSQINVQTLENTQNQNLIQSWQSHLSQNADLLIYGCDFAASSSGQLAANLLSEISGLDVAASTNLTGSSALGADWVLEYETGLIEANAVISAPQQQLWQSTLATIVVNTAEDQSLGFGIDNVNELLSFESEISLREAIQAINKEFSFDGSTQHIIHFDLDTDQSINLAGALPTIQRSVIIDGTSDPDYAGTPVIQLIGSGNVISVSADNVEIRGLEITGGFNGITLSGDNNTVAGNYIHDNVYEGVRVTGSGNTVGGDNLNDKNIISGNGGYGVEIAGLYADYNAVTGNWIGTSLEGTEDYGNTGSGIYISGGVNNTSINNNVVSGNGEYGIHIEQTNSYNTSHHSILGNIIGLNASGTAALANDSHGIFVVNSNDIAIGDGTEGGRNVISGNLQHGIQIHLDSSDITIQGNYVGTDVSGTQAIGNGYNGVEIYGGPESEWTFGGGNNLYGRVLVGGTQAGQGNLISGNSGDGVTVDKDAVGVNIFGNFIGTDFSGTQDLGNFANGITVKAGGDTTTVNAQTDIQDNIIAFNKLSGVEVRDTSNQVWIFNNQIFDNGELGIDLGADGFTPNDPADFDNGANRLLNFPVINALTVNDNQLRITGTLEYSGYNTADITLHFYYADHESDSGAANAQTYIGEYFFTGNSSGIENFDELFDVEIPAGSFITATSTGNVGSSEFAPAIYLAQGNIPNQEPTGTVEISGDLIQGALLTAASSLSDPNGISSPLQYQWRRNGVAIDSANQSTYQLQEADVGSQIQVEVYYTDDDGYAESALSSATSNIANVNDPATGTATISGNRSEDETLTAVYNITDPDGMPGGVNIQWYRDGAAINDATASTYRLGDADVGSAISYQISFTDLQGSEELINSSATAPIANVNDAPTGDVYISGSANEDSTLTAVLNISDADGLSGTYFYQWYRDGAAISGATSDSYMLDDDDVGSAIHFSVTYQDLQGATEVLTSTSSGIVNNSNDAPVGTLEIVGSNVEGETLSAQVNFNDADGISNPISYQWYRDGSIISGANTDTYLVTNADVGSALQVTATYQDDYGRVENVSSASTNPVNNTNQAPSGTVSIAGQAEENQVLTVDINLSDPDGLPADFQYLWYRDGEAVIGADQAQYTLGDRDVGSTISVEISYTDNLGSRESVLSAATDTVVNVNDAVSGSLSIVGSNQEGQTLNTQISISDEDGLPGELYYQWFRDDQAIAGATGQNYSLTSEDIGAQISVSVSYTDLRGSEESLSSAAFGPIVNVNAAPTGSVDIAGNTREDSILTAENNFADADGLPPSFAYQWYRDGAPVSGETGRSYQLDDEDVGSAITVSVSYTDNQGSEESILSDATASVANINDLPTGALTVQGNSAEGQTLNLVSTITDDDGIASPLTYQWYRNGVAISGETSASYQITAADIGSELYATAQYQDGQGTIETVQSQTLSNIQNINATPTGSVLISGEALEDTVLSVSNTINDADGISSAIGYQWYRDGVAIEGATNSTLQLQDADAGATLHVIARYTDDYGTQETIASQGFGPIANVNDTPSGTVNISGSAEEGQTLTASHSLTDPDGIIGPVEYQWYRNDEAIAGAVGQSLTLDDIDVGSTIKVVAVYTDDFGTMEFVASQSTPTISGINDAPSGSVMISGEAREDASLLAEHSLQDVDGMSTPVSYQWYRNDELIAGATSANYRLSDADVGAVIHVEAHYVDDGGTTERVASLATASVVNINDAPTGSINLQGDALEDSTLIISRNFSDADGLPNDFIYQWYRDGIAIPNTNSASYTLQAEDVGANISAEIRYTDNQGSEETLLSTASAAIAAVNHPVEGSITISGNPAIGGQLQANINLVDPDGLGNAQFSYQWLRDGTVIEGATEASYTLGLEDVGKYLSVQVSFVDARGYDENAISATFMFQNAAITDNTDNIEDLVVNIAAPGFAEEAAINGAEEPSEPTETQAESVTDSATTSPQIEEGVPITHHAPAQESIFNHQDRFQLSSAAQSLSDTAVSTLDNNTSLSPQSARNDFAFGFLQIYKEADGPLDIGAQNLSRMLNILDNRDYADRVESSVNQVEDQSIRVTSAIIGGTTAVSTGLSLGYLAWTLRSGILMTSLLSSLPAWRFIDPLPILESQRKLTDDDDESLESMVASSSTSAKHEDRKHV